MGIEVGLGVCIGAWGEGVGKTAVGFWLLILFASGISALVNGVGVDWQATKVHAMQTMIKKCCRWFTVIDTAYSSPIVAFQSER